MKKYYKFVFALVLVAILTIANLVYFSRRVSYAEPAAISSNRDPSKLLFCIILTSPNNLRNSTKPYIVLHTWASKCSDYRFVTSLPDVIRKNLSSQNELVVPEPLNWYQPAGFESETGNNYKLTTKVFLSMLEIHTKHGDYDFYLKADDDTFVFVENLKQYLSERDPNVPATYGHDMNYKVRNGYPSGGAGYVLSNRALKLLSEKLSTNMSSCRNNGIEDLNMGECLRTVGVDPVNTRDEQGRARFNLFSIEGHYAGDYPDWYLNRITARPKPGFECCADDWISFHYMTPEKMFRLRTVIDRQTELYAQNQLLTNKRPSFKRIYESYVAYDRFHGLLMKKGK